MSDKDTTQLIEKAKASLRAAEILLKEDYPDFSVSRSYYAMFYAAEAILLSRKLSFSKHKAVISAFGKEFVKTGMLPTYLHRYISEAFDLRQAGDYGSLHAVSREKAKSVIINTKVFIEEIAAYLKK